MSELQQLSESLSLEIKSGDLAMIKQYLFQMASLVEQLQEK